MCLFHRNVSLLGPIFCVSMKILGFQQGVNFINILRAHFLYKTLAPKITKLREALLYKILVPKTHFCMKNARIKCWWNWHKFSSCYAKIIPSTLFVSANWLPQQLWLYPINNKTRFIPVSRLQEHSFRAS